MTRGGRDVKIHKGLRPTTGRVREALFDILRERIENAHFLDLYAGTGAVGLDALREGAADVVFVEESRAYTRRIAALVERSGFTEKTRIITKKVLSFIDRAQINQMTFDIIFLDPPYHTDEIMHALFAIDRADILGRNGIVAAEHFTKRQLPGKFNTLQKVKDYRYGDTVLSLYRNLNVA